MADDSVELDLKLTNNTTQTNKLELPQPLKTENVQTLDVKPQSQTLEVKPLTQTTNQSLELKPVKVDSNSRQEVAYTDPIRTDASSNSTLDLKPIALDVCMRTGPASLPPTHVCEPYHHRIGLTLLGVEVFGVAWSGETQTIVQDRGGRPMVAWGPVVSAPPTVHVDLPQHGHHPHRHGGGHHQRGAGLRIRL